jgi:hypothetical protein
VVAFARLITGWAPLVARLEAGQASAASIVRELLHHFGFVALVSFTDARSAVTTSSFAPLGERAPPRFGV